MQFAHVGDEILPQVEEFKYLMVLFTSEGRMEREIDRRIGAVSAVMQTLHGSVMVKRELSRKAKLSIYQSIFVPALTYGHVLWVVTERTRSRVQAAEMSFLCKLGCLPDASLVRCSGHIPLVGDLGEDPGHAGETMSLYEVAGEREVWASLLRLLPPRPDPG
ncbi:hypothetical protein N1851_021942 [Merluccius polli]|uniref:Uncharacterized protein n=1 Tax=Merluccius polli TaxID=89951 RepID=A0AA47MJ33_MERPO|nr:hypothetical protein N1851_021942 [Merluccius polli]